MENPLRHRTSVSSQKKILQRPKRVSGEIGLRPAIASKAVSKNREVSKGQRSRRGACSVPFPQKDRIKQKFMASKNISAIAREEGRHWETVAKIVKEEDVLEHVKDLRARFYLNPS